MAETEGGRGFGPPLENNKLSHLFLRRKTGIVWIRARMSDGGFLFILVYVEWASRVNFVTIFGDLYQNKLLVIYNNLNQFAHLSSASGPSNDVIKTATIVLLMYTYKTSYLKQ